MSDLAGPAPRARRRRSDAERSIAAILDAAARILGRDPQASMEEIARAAGTSRQTIYAHFPSREALLSTLVDRVTAQVLTALEAADLEHVPPGEGLVRLIEIGWETVDAQPFLLQLPAEPGGSAEDRARHEPVIGHLERLIRRGRRDGEFDRSLPVPWMVAAALALGHAAGEEVRAGRMSSAEARVVLQRSLSRLFEA